jgi:hypothetical protein
MQTPDQEIQSLKARIRLLETIVLEGKPYSPDQAEYDRAIRQIVTEGRTDLMALFYKRGGIVPCCEPKEATASKLDQRGG